MQEDNDTGPKSPVAIVIESSDEVDKNEEAVSLVWRESRDEASSYFWESEMRSRFITGLKWVRCGEAVSLICGKWGGSSVVGLVSKSFFFRKLYLVI